MAWEDANCTTAEPEVAVRDEDDVDFSNFCYPEEIWYRRSSAEIIIKSVAIAPLALAAVLGNLAVIRVSVKAKLLRNPVHLFILNMSIANLLCAVFFPWVILVNHFYQNFVLGAFLCKTESFFIKMLMLASSLSLTFISYEHLKAVLFPFKQRMTHGTAKKLVRVVWIVSVVSAAPLLIWRTYHERKWKNYVEKWCAPEAADHGTLSKYYWPIMLIFMVWFPLFVLILSYTVIVLKLDALERRQREHPAQVKFKSKVIRMLFSIVIAFAICWIPFSVFIIMRSHIVSEMYPTWYHTFYYVSHYLMLVNSAINPIIYGLQNDHFKREIRLALPSWARFRKTCEISTITSPAWQPGACSTVALKPQLRLNRRELTPTYFNYH